MPRPQGFPRPILPRLTSHGYLRHGGLERRTVALALVLAALALTAPAAASAAGSISGNVTDANSHEPIAGVRVCAFQPVPEEEEAEVELCTHSEASGSYQLGPLASGEYGVDFLPGAEGLNYVYQAWNDKPSRFDAEPIPVGSTDVPGIDAALSEGGEIGGTVTGTPLGQPLAGIEVCAEPESFPGTEGCTLTAANGSYMIAGLAADSYRVAFRPPEGVEFLEQFYAGEAKGWEADPVPVTVGVVTPNVNAALQEAGQITGTVTDALTHAPVANLTVYAFDAFGNEYIHFPAGDTDAAGRYTIPLLAPGPYKVRFSPEPQLPGEYADQWYRCNKETVVTVTAGHATPGIDATMTKQGTFPCESAPEPTPPPPPKPKKAHKCKKGFHKKRVKGKARCVKKRAKHRHRQHHGRAPAHRPPARLR